MKSTVKICRALKVATTFLKGAVGLDTEASPDAVYAAILENFGPMAPGIRFWVEGTKTVVTKEIMAFDIKESRIPFAATFINGEPLDQGSITRADGALESEMARMGIPTNPKEYEYRVIAMTDGN